MKYRPCLVFCFHIMTKSEHQPGRYDNYGKHFQKIAEWRRIFKGMGTVGIEKTTSVCSQLLDGNLRSRRSQGDDLIRTL